MKSTFAGMVERARAILSTISLGQKVVIGLLLAGLLLGGFYFFNWVTTPAQAPLFSNLASKDASAIVDELTAEHGVVTSETVPALSAMTCNEQSGGMHLPRYALEGVNHRSSGGVG